MEGPSIMSKIEEIKSDISWVGDEEFKVLKNHIKQEEKSRRTKKAKETRQKKLAEKEKTKADDDMDDIMETMGSMSGLHKKRRTSKRTRRKVVQHNVQPSKPRVKRKKEKTPPSLDSLYKGLNIGNKRQRKKSPPKKLPSLSSKDSDL